jgi:N-glycosidase YbiA
MHEPIYFYTPDGPFGDFSNFARYGVWWTTAEHFFQAQKFHDLAWREKIRRASSPRMAADLGRTRTLPLRPDWDTGRVAVMRRVVFAKFRTHAAVRDLLLSTGLWWKARRAMPSGAVGRTGPARTGWGGCWKRCATCCRQAGCRRTNHRLDTPRLIPDKRASRRGAKSCRVFNS